MKKSTTTLLAATLVTLLSVSQSAMALNEDSAGYSLLLNGSPSYSEVAMPTASFRGHAEEIGNSENGIDPAYVGVGYVETIVYENQTPNVELNFLSGEFTTR